MGAPERSNPPEQSSGFDRDQFRDFLQHTCHDLRSPLRTMRSSAELLRSPERRSGVALDEILGFIIDGSRNIDSLVDGLSDFALALSTGASSFEPTRTDAVVRSALATLAPELKECGAEVVYGALPRVPGDSDRLAQVFENLLRNAVRHRGKDAPRIQISAELSNGSWLFAVGDNGPGVEPEYLEKIFRPFERLRREPSSGPGLGLAICREIVVQHGGKIWAESQPGTGLTIYFTLPANEE